MAEVFWVMWSKHSELTDRDWENAVQGLGKASGSSGQCVYPHDLPM